MKQRIHRIRFHRPLLALALGTGLATAGTTETMMTPAPAAPADDVVSGVLKLDLNTHFISYGLDVWSDDAPGISEINFNPMIEFSFDLPGDFALTLGTWADVTDKGGDPLGGNIQEIDIWAGLSYTYDKWTFAVTGQEWFYGSMTEDILDIKIAYDTFLSPSLTLHNRLGAGAAGAAGGDEGSILVLGLSHGIEAGPVSISFPFNVAYFLTDDYHLVGADTGFGFASLGVGASLPLSPYMGSSFGEWTLNGGITYYITDDDIIPNNDHSDFFTASVGLSLDF